MKKFFVAIFAVLFTLSFVFTSQVNAVSRFGTCDFRGTRKANAVVNVGVGNRAYFAHTNSHGQLVKVTANRIVLHTGHGRFCKDEANVPGTQSRLYDKGHAIADSLGGVSNAYNITPQNLHVNRRGGAQYKFEDNIRRAIRSGHRVTNFVYTIFYKTARTQTPYKYHVEYKDTFRGKSHVTKLTFSNGNVRAAAPAKRVTTHKVSSNKSLYHWGNNGRTCYQYHHRGAVKSSFCAGL